MKVTDADLLYLKQNQPKLKFIPPGQIVGEVSFVMEYNPKTFKGYRIYNSSAVNESETLIKDSYSIEIDATAEDKLPVCKSTDQRLEQHLEELKKFPHLNIKNIHDLHINVGDTFCLGFLPDFIEIDFRNLSLKDYFEDFIVPFLYYQSFLIRNKKEAWKGYGHGTVIALGEFAYDNRSNPKEIDDLVRKLTEYGRSLVVDTSVHYGAQCHCGSSKQWRNCHYRAAIGLKKLKRKLNIY